MAEIKTVENDADVEAFLNAVDNERRRADGFTVLAMMRDITGEEPKMWGDAIIGFGRYHYRYESGREGDMPLAAFSPRKQNLTIYITSDFDRYEALRARLGKHKVGKVCLYINKLSDVDESVLREMIRESYELTKATHQAS
jgi:hypothetical protein